MASTVPRICIFSPIPGLFQAVRKALPLAEVVDVKYPVKDSEVWQDVEKEKVLQAEILLADPNLIVKHDFIYLPQLKWMQSTFAGVDALLKSVDNSKPFPTYQLTRIGVGFGTNMAEYVLGMIISRERQFPEMARAQQKKEWRQDDYNGYRLLSRLTLGVLGLGSIGGEVAKKAKSFGMQVWGLGSQDGSPRTPCSHIDEYRGPSGMPELLAACDYVCSILPSTPKTTGLLSGDVLSHCSQKKPIYINVGRGDVIDEESILKALSKGWISGAVLDVFEKEPLPTTSALWDHPAVTVTPHVSGISQVEETQNLFLENYELYVEGKPLKYQVNWEYGY